MPLQADLDASFGQFTIWMEGGGNEGHSVRASHPGRAIIFCDIGHDQGLADLLDGSENARSVFEESQTAFPRPLFLVIFDSDVGIF